MLQNLWCWHRLSFLRATLLKKLWHCCSLHCCTQLARIFRTVCCHLEAVATRLFSLSCWVGMWMGLVGIMSFNLLQVSNFGTAVLISVVNRCWLTIRICQIRADLDLKCLTHRCPSYLRGNFAPQFFRPKAHHPHQLCCKSCFLTSTWWVQLARTHTLVRKQKKDTKKRSGSSTGRSYRSLFWRAAHNSVGWRMFERCSK